MLPTKLVSASLLVLALTALAQKDQAPDSESIDVQGFIKSFDLIGQQIAHQVQLEDLSRSISLLQLEVEEASLKQRLSDIQTIEPPAVEVNEVATNSQPEAVEFGFIAWSSPTQSSAGWAALQPADEQSNSGLRIVKLGQTLRRGSQEWLLKDIGTNFLVLEGVAGKLHYVYH